MKVIKVALPEEINEVELHIFSDEHIGDAQCDIQRLQERINYVRDTANAYCVLNGDIIDFASRTSIGDVESRKLNIMEQISKAQELFKPISNKILAITTGNHEERAYNNTGIDISAIIAEAFGISDRYSKTSAFLYVSYGANRHNTGANLVTIYMTHGSGGGRKEGSKVVRLADMASIVDADIYIHSHTHLPVVMKELFYRSDYSNKSVKPVNKLFVNTAANLDYGGYGEAKEFKPASKDTPVIYISTRRSKYNALGKKKDVVEQVLQAKL